jgi:hypothetical protein
MPIHKYSDNPSQAWDRHGDPARQAFAGQPFVDHPNADGRCPQMRQRQIQIQRHLLVGSGVAGPHGNDKSGA